MPQLKSSAKRLRQSIKRAKSNKAVKDNIDYLFRQFKKAIRNADKTAAQEYSRKLIKSIDKAAKRNIYKKNKAARKKSQLMKKVNALKK
jgi:small subunit ribosomal protein S20